MGQILSASSIYAVAYLTEKGRKYLFDENNIRYTTTSTGELIDRFKITHFSLSDPDVNYNLVSGTILESGDIPDVSGENEGSIKGTVMSTEKNLISYDDSIGSNTTYIYSTSQSNNSLVLNINKSGLIPPPINVGPEESI